MDRGKILRRAVHLSAPLFSLLYFVPEIVPDIDWHLAVVIIWGAFFVFDILRRRFKWDFPGLRPYEMERMSAAAWFVSALAILLLFFPFEYALPVLLGLGVVDPLNGDLRRAGSNLYPLAPSLLYFAMTLALLFHFFGMTPVVLLAALAATVAAMGAESIRSKVVDDDFLMVIVPAVVLAVVFALAA